MTVTRPTAFWIAIAVAAVLTLALLREILLPFGVGMALAYLLAPAVDGLERAGFNRALAALMLVLLLAVAFVGIVLATLPALVGEMRFFVEAFPRSVARVQSLLADTSRPWLRTVMGSGFRTEESISHAVAGMGTAWFDDLVRSAWSGGKALFSLLSLLVVAPIVGVYLLIDWDRMIATIDGWVPVPHRENVQALRREIHGTVSGFVRGQATICLILAVLYSAALRSLGLEHAVLIGVSAGLISFVPYLGFGVGFVVATCVATAQFWPDWTRLAEVAAVFLVGESLADYVLSPRMIGSRVRLSPVWVMFSLFAFGYLFGFIGLLVAIPAAASLGVLLRFAMQKSLEGPAPGDASSPLGSGASARGPACPGRERIGPSSREDPAPALREAAAAWPQAQPKAPWDAGPQNGQADLRAR